jgi:hypothetical protein
MGGKSAKEKIREKAIIVFAKIDIDKSGSIDKEECLKFW